MVERVETGGLMSFKYENQEKKTLNEADKKEIERGYDEYYERKRREKRNKIIVWVFILLIILIIISAVVF